MGFKTGLIVGAGIGYVFATRLDPQTRNRIEAEVNRRVAQIREDPRVKDVIGSVTAVTADVIDRADDKLDDALDDAFDDKVTT